MRDHLTISEAAREITRDLGDEVHPRDISDLFYQRRVADELGPIVGGRRLIAPTTLPLIVDALRLRGKLNCG